MWAGVVPQQPPTIRAPASSEPRHDRAELGAARRVDEPALDALGQAGVGHDRARRVAVGRGAVALQRIETRERPDAAVDADRVDAGRRSARPTTASGVVPSASVTSSPNVIDAIDGDVGGAMGLVDREQQVREVEERLEDEQVHAALEEPVDLLAEGGPDRRLVGMAELARRRAQRADAAADPRVAAADVARLAGDLGARAG